MTARRAMVALCGAAVAVFTSVPATAQEAPEPVTVAEGLEFPTGIAFDSRGRMYVNERPGRIRVVRGRRLLPRPLAKIPTQTEGETGLLGIAVSPNDDSVYVFATDPGGESNRVLRVAPTGGAPEPVVTGLPASLYHNGGGVAFDQDGMLLVSNGEQHVSERSQDPQSLGGKVYRYTPEGDVPRDNPFGDAPAFAIGLRNPFGLTVDPVSGAAFVTENGPSSHDEINRVVAGGNYGWPLFSGPASGQDATGLAGRYRDPLLAYPEIIVPTGIAFADPRRALPRFAGDLFFAAYGEQAIHRVRLNAARTAAVSDEVFLSVAEPIVALAWGPRGLYYSTPDSVRLVPLARTRARAGPSPTSEPTAPELAASPEPQAATREGGSWGWAAAAIVVLGAILLAAMIARRR